MCIIRISFCLSLFNLSSNPNAKQICLTYAKIFEGGYNENSQTDPGLTLAQNLL